MQKPQANSPWLWVPSLYFAQAIPYVVVMSLSVIMYKDMGISNSDIAFYTSLLYLPWVIKPLWSPIVDMFGTKRRWTVLLQLAVGGSLIAVGTVLHLPTFFVVSL
ncbi:MAG: MFS transporter, partial [Massilia sp.]